MAYSDFDLRSVKRDLGLRLIEQQEVFSAIKPLGLHPYFQQTLQDNILLARAINTEKARSELIISPMLVEVRRLLDRKISLFSGIEFNVNKEQGLNGFCDFIISQSAEQLMLNSPVIAVVEAKNENIIAGLGQCIAEMYAAEIFNDNVNNTEISTIYGVVTTGTAWKFLKLTEQAVTIDMEEYPIEQAGMILGILSSMMKTSEIE